jgi:hypothetical protein
MVKSKSVARLAFGLVLLVAGMTSAQQGSIRGAVGDKEFDVPLAGAQVLIVETNQKTVTQDGGNYVFTEVAPGAYTLVFSKDGYSRQVVADVTVAPGKLTDVDVSLSGEFTELEELVVQDIQVGSGTETSLLQLRLDSPALLDSISSELISRAGVGDAAGALRLVAGASVQEGKYAVVRGLPDRYVNSQMNAVRLPSADENKRAVQLDQFPTAVIDSIQVSKTFTPDQQGDASGGAVNVVLKGIPTEEAFARFSSQVNWNSQASGRSDFASYHGGGVGLLGLDDGRRDQQLGSLGGNWAGAVGVSGIDAPTDSKWSLSAGGNREIAKGIKIGGSANVFYERYSSFYDHGVNDSYWVEHPGAPMTPTTVQGTPQQGDFKTQLFDVTRGVQGVRWGALGTVGIETKEHSVGLTWLHTQTTEDTATLAQDTRGKALFFPGYDPNDNSTPGHDQPTAAPYLRLETLDYIERATDTIQIKGKHAFKTKRFGPGNFINFQSPEVDWTFALSSSSLNEPDKRQFGSVWLPGQNLGGFIIPPRWIEYQPSESFTLGNLQRIWKQIDEESQQYQINVKLPFDQWSGDKGYVKTGFFLDKVDRTFNQDTFSNFNDSNAQRQGGFDDPWSAHFPSEDHPITASDFDVDYKGSQQIMAGYGMIDLPLCKELHVIGGLRLESTDIGIQNFAEPSATWFPPGAQAPTILNPGDADVMFRQLDLLPSFALEYKPAKEVTLRGAYNETVARQTFKELSPIIQEEYLGGPVFIGNPLLKMSAVKNYDLRADWTPYAGSLVSASWFAKDIKDPIEYVQRIVTFEYTTPVNYPEGHLSGFEFEVRQNLGHFWKGLDGLSVGANATFIDSEVTLPPEEAAGFDGPGILAPMHTRAMTNAPEHLYNLNATYDIAASGTQLSLFWSVQGDTLLAGAGQSSGNFVPSLYAREYGTLNAGVSQKLGEHFKLQFQAKNLTNPEIQTVYRSEFIGADVRHSSFTKGVDLSLMIGGEFKF